MRASKVGSQLYIVISARGCRRVKCRDDLAFFVRFCRFFFAWLVRDRFGRTSYSICGRLSYVSSDKDLLALRRSDDSFQYVDGVYSSYFSSLGPYIYRFHLSLFASSHYGGLAKTARASLVDLSIANYVSVEDDIV